LLSSTTPTASSTRTYNAAGRLLTIAGGGVTTTFDYEGFLKTSATVTGLVPSHTYAIAWTFDNLFRVTNQTINGSSSVGSAFDADGLLNDAGGMSLERHLQNGMLLGSTLGQVTDTYPARLVPPFSAYDGHADGRERRGRALHPGDARPLQARDEQLYTRVSTRKLQEIHARRTRRGPNPTKATSVVADDAGSFATVGAASELIPSLAAQAAEEAGG
jgi:hypothetical protein